MNISPNAQEPFHYALPVDDQIFHDGLHVTNAGWEQVRPKQTYPNPNHPSLNMFEWESGREMPAFTIAWLMAGQGEFQTKKEHLMLKKGSVFLILPGEWHRHRPSFELGWSLAWIEFNGTLPYEWWEGGAFGARPNLLSVRNEKLFALQFQNLLHEVRLNPASNTRILSLMTIGIMAQLLEDTGKSPYTDGSGDSVVDKAVESIWNFSHGVINVDEVAQRAGVGRRALERRFKKTKGHSVLEEIQNCRLKRASRLLAETQLPIKVIVDRAGFGSYEQFRKTFQKAKGMTPQTYRERAMPTPMVKKSRKS